MITFLVAIALLLIGYAVYGKIAEKIIAPSAERKTPAYTMQDGVDYIPMPTWKIFMIQFLNIAGLGPEIRSVSLFVDCYRMHFHRFSSRLPFRHDVTQNEWRQLARHCREILGRQDKTCDANLHGSADGNGRRGIRIRTSSNTGQNHSRFF